MLGLKLIHFSKMSPFINWIRMKSFNVAGFALFSCFVVVEYRSIPCISFKACIHWVERRLTTRSHKVSNQRDSGLDFSNRSENWQAHRQHYCRYASQNCRAIRSLQHPISRLRYFTRFGSETSYRLVNGGPGFLHRGNHTVPVKEPERNHVTTPNNAEQNIFYWIYSSQHTVCPTICSAHETV